MAISYMDYSDPNTKFSFDMESNTIFRKNRENYINAAGTQQLNTMGDTFLLDVYLTSGNVVEPHYHPNASEVLYCITGEAVVSLINPSTNELKNSSIKQGQIASVPQGWWHYATAVSNQCHLLAIHDTPMLQTVWGSDVLRITPPQVLAHTYCLNEGQVEKALSPINDTVIIGPPSDCHKDNHSPKYGYSGAKQSYQPYYSQYPYMQNPYFR